MCFQGHLHGANGIPGLQRLQATKQKQRLVFYTMPEYEAWKESLGGSTSGWNIKYYKASLAVC